MSTVISERTFNGRRFALAVVVVFAFVYLYEWALHGWLLAERYAATAELWRAPEIMPAYGHWLALGYAVFALFFAAVYLRFRRSGRPGEGAYYGLLIGLMYSGTYSIFYAVQPLPPMLVIYWCAGAVVEGLLAGVLLAGVYRERELFA